MTRLKTPEEVAPELARQLGPHLDLHPQVRVTSVNVAEDGRSLIVEGELPSMAELRAPETVRVDSEWLAHAVRDILLTA